MQCERLLSRIRLVLVTQKLDSRDDQTGYKTDAKKEKTHSINVITSMRFQMWELSVIFATEITDTVWERREHNHTHTKHTQKRTNSKITYEVRQWHQSGLHLCVTATDKLLFFKIPKTINNAQKPQEHTQCY